MVVAFGGQTAIKLTKFLDESGIPIFGTSAEGIDIAEDRERFDALLEHAPLPPPQGPHRPDPGRRPPGRGELWATPSSCAPAMSSAGRT